MKQNARFVNVFRNTDKLRIIHSTLTPQQPSLPTSIYLATLSQTWVLSHLNYNLHPLHPAEKHKKIASHIGVKPYHQTEQTDGMNIDHSNLNIVCIIYIIPYVYICILCYLVIFFIIIIYYYYYYYYYYY